MFALWRAVKALGPGEEALSIRLGLCAVVDTQFDSEHPQWRAIFGGGKVCLPAVLTTAVSRDDHIVARAFQSPQQLTTRR